MELRIDVTWPTSMGHLYIAIPEINAGNVKIISPNKASRAGNRLTIDRAFGRPNRVCDDDRYRITRQNGAYLECRQTCGPGAPFVRTLVIIMESPHRSEYRSDCIDAPIGPAQGRTGHNILDYLTCVLGSCRHILHRLDQQTLNRMGKKIRNSACSLN